MRGRPVTARHSRSAHRFASVAVSAKLHCGTVKRRASSAPTTAASSVGIITVAPPSSAKRVATAATVGAGECPAIAPVSPEAEVDELVAVDVGDARADGAIEVQGEAAGVL